ncbi:MAG: Ig-like domain-containing protein, partial [Chloroflexota bacterium]
MKLRFWLLAVAGLLTGAVVLLLWLSPRVASRQPADPAAAWQPIVVTFNRPIRSDSVAGRLVIEPAVDGASRVEGRQLIFEPARPLAYNQRYTVTLEAGVIGQNRLPMLLDERWSFELAPPQLVYLLEQDSRVNLWRRADDGSAEQLTDEGAGVWDYAPLPDGRGLVYSALDPDDDTVDLVFLSHDGQTTSLLDCQNALCRAPAPQPGGQLIAYERLPLGAGLNASELWLLDSESGQTQPAPVPAALAATGFDASLGRHARWSADG